jgi:hypothetical protein
MTSTPAANSPAEIGFSIQFGSIGAIDFRQCMVA